MAPIETTASGEFNKQLKTLCLDEYPCGFGSWRDADEKVKVNTQFAVTMKEYNVNTEQLESLEELIKSKFSPWAFDCSWSDEAIELRELAVKQPDIVTKQFVLAYFRTLRLVDKQITTVDSALLKFPNLEDISLAANNIEIVDSANLPRTLKVLELYANEISDLRLFCHKPPRLEHLGLGKNQIYNIEEHLTGIHWPQLLSLDLSHNFLTDLKDAVAKFSSLPKLRNLILIGNPLCMTPAYRGYIIDSLRELMVLDDERVTADDKHIFKGIARQKDNIQNEAKIRIQIQFAKGIPPPPELLVEQEKNAPPEYPITEKKFLVEYHFLAARHRAQTPVAESDDNQGLIDDQSLLTDTKPKTPDVLSEVDDLEGAAEATAVDTVTGEIGLTDQDPPDPEEEGEGEGEGEGLNLVDIDSIKTTALDWSEEGLMFEYDKELFVTDLLALREFTKTGIVFSILEQKTLLSLPQPEEVTAEPSKGSAKSKKSSAKGGKGKPATPPKGKDDKKGKKKSDPVIELVRSSPEFTVLGSYTVNIESFTEGGSYIKAYCHCGGGELVPEESREPTPQPLKKDAKKKGGKNSAKGKKEKPKVTLVEEGQEELPPPPMFIKAEVTLQQWKSAAESLVNKKYTQNQ